MKSTRDSAPSSKSKDNDGHISQGGGLSTADMGVTDNRLEATSLLEEKEMVQNSPRTVAQRQAFGAAMGYGAEVPPNETGMPDHLKSGLEGVSGFDLSDVRVHYNSRKPSQVGALAYAQGNQIYLGSGQEKYLPHEGWHVVQQRQGRVKPTMILNGNPVNNNPGLEREADSMGQKLNTQKDEGETTQRKEKKTAGITQSNSSAHHPIQGIGFRGDLVEGDYYLIMSDDGNSIGMYQRTETSDEISTYYFLDYFSSDEIELKNTDAYDDLFVMRLISDEDMADAMDTVEEHMEDEGLPQIDESALEFTYGGIDIGAQLQALVKSNDIEVIQGKILASAYAAPANAAVSMTGPLAAGAAPGANPPGWIGGGHPNHHHRGHLIGKQFGGVGTVNNLMTLTDGTNHPIMTAYENALAALVNASPGKVFTYIVTPLYNKAFKQVTSAGATGGAGQVVIQHPAPVQVQLYAKNMTTKAVIINNAVINNGALQNHKACVD